MNEYIDLRKILKDCPKGTILYSLIHGYVEFSKILDKGSRVIEVISITSSGKRYVEHYTFRGQLHSVYNNDECVLFPSQTQRDWSKFKAPWYRKERFDPKTLKPFDKIIARVEGGIWFCELLSFIEEGRNLIKGFVSYYNYCIPYNDETKHLVGTTEEAPEYYRYWEE